ncbi:MAG TPA: homoserine dehydrogenase [Fimbriimonadaceae bacterium]|nr:homoserine dehydrogenase [Fimbriimonadaceae bacterium]
MDNRKRITVGLLGFGTVGEGTYRMICDNEEEILQKIGIPIEVRRIGVRDASKPRSLPGEFFTTDLESIVDDPEIAVVVELIGGEEPALSLIDRSLDNGKHVVTANKELIAKHGSRLVTKARDNRLDLHFEAAVGGGIPIVQPLKHQLAGNDIVKMMGVLNGTSNYILTKMYADGASFEEALAGAQEQGYAEADPTNDVDGYDTMYKIAILAAIAFGKQVPLDGIYREGIRRIGERDMHYAEVLGYRIKLLGIVEEAGPGEILIRVHPTLVPADHQIAKVEDAYNALWLHGDFVGDLMFSGRGAGSFPTASAVVGDLIDVARNIVVGGAGSAIPYGEGMSCKPIADLETRYYIRLVVTDRPNTLGRIATVFGEAGVGLSAMEMRTLDNEQGEIVFMTHKCKESAFTTALELVETLLVVSSLESWIRVEE